MSRTIFQQLEHDLSCCIETNNREEAKTVIAQAESAHEADCITEQELGDLVCDYCGADFGEA